MLGQNLSSSTVPIRSITLFGHYALSAICIFAKHSRDHSVTVYPSPDSVLGAFSSFWITPLSGIPASVSFPCNSTGFRVCANASESRPRLRGGTQETTRLPGKTAASDSHATRSKTASSGVARRFGRTIYHASYYLQSSCLRSSCLQSSRLPGCRSLEDRRLGLGGRAKAVARSSAVESRDQAGIRIQALCCFVKRSPRTHAINASHGS